MRWKRLLFFLLINILVSAGTTLLVLNLWERYRAPLVSDPAAEQQTAGLPPTARPATPTPQPEAATTPPEGFSLQAYQVQPGETLGEIALAFDLSVDELLALNGRTDPNSIGAGEVLFVPVLAEEPAAPSPAGPLVTPTQLPTRPAGAELVEVQIVTVIGLGDLA
ncbi:MAG: LysM peptidoglycan-binding domain-containing protein, partial [Anaerolineales bacterium]|nr:LysM peptidoglycan-binding domain-containing protein [Anaerolineales bacterium]